MIQEELLEAWLSMSLLVRGNRVLNNLSYNEMIILRLLKEEKGITAKQLGEVMHLHKSQIAGLVKSLENKDFIERKQDIKDKRRILIFLKKDSVYKTEHKKIRKIMNRLVDKLGDEKAKEFTMLLNQAESILKGEN